MPPYSLAQCCRGYTHQREHSKTPGKLNENFISDLFPDYVIMIIVLISEIGLIEKRTLKSRQPLSLSILLIMSRTFNENHIKTMPYTNPKAKYLGLMSLSWTI